MRKVNQEGTMRNSQKNRLYNRLASTVVGCVFMLFLVVAPVALAGPPNHLRLSGLDIEGFDHACGTAVDSQGDVYVSSAGDSQIRVFDPEHNLLASISDSNGPCGLAVDGKGNLYASDTATGDVVRYVPNFYPFAGAPIYGFPSTIDSSGQAKGIAVDPHDNRLYVAEGTHVAAYKADGSFEGNIAEGEISGATGIAVYTYVVEPPGNEGGLFEEKANRRLFVAEGSANRLELYGGTLVRTNTGTTFAVPKLRRTIEGVDQDHNPATPDQTLGLSAEVYLAVDPGNGDPSSLKCENLVAEQACTAGHFLVYDAAHKVVDEFDAAGEFLDQMKDPGFADAEPTAMAVDRSGGATDGTVYVTAGSSTGAKLLAFAPLAAPGRASLPGLSRKLPTASAVTVDSHGDVYVRAGSLIHVYGPDGTEIKVGPEGNGIEDPNKALELAVDSTGVLYVRDEFATENRNRKVTYYTPSAYPPVDGTTYSRHEPPLVTNLSFGGETEYEVTGLAVDPTNDHVLVGRKGKGQYHIFELDSAAKGSALIRDFGSNLNLGELGSTAGARLAVYGANGNIYIAGNSGIVAVTDNAGTEVVALIDDNRNFAGPAYQNPQIAVDQSNGHLLVFLIGQGVAREYDAAGSFIAEFGGMSEGSSTQTTEIAIDNSGGPTDGNVYVAYDDPSPAQPYDLFAFAPLSYGETPLAVTRGATGVGGGSATVNGTVDPQGFNLSDCRFEYVSDTTYVANGETFAGATPVSCAESLGEIGNGTGPVAVHADLHGLDAEARYRYRLVAANRYGSSEGEPGLFGPPVVTSEPALPVFYSEATVRATIDPSGLATKYRFEYGTSENYSQSTPVGLLPAGDGAVAVKAILTGLVEATTYHFRVVAENEAGIVPGPDQALVTQQRLGEAACGNVEYRTGPSAGLPNCRAYELITPAETNGLVPISYQIKGGGEGFNDWLVAQRGDGAGDSVTYFTGGTLPGFHGNGYLDGYNATRGEGAHPPDGWSTRVAGPSYAQAVPDFTHNTNQEGVSPDQLYSFWNVEPAAMFTETLAEGLWLSTPSGFEPVGRGTLGIDMKAQSYYVSPGGSHVIFSSKARLEEGEGNEAAPAGTTTLYDRKAGAGNARVVSLAPGDVPFGAGEDASYVGSSEDGSAVVFRVGGVLYVRRDGTTSEVAGTPNTFAGISTDGRRVFYAATGVDKTPAVISVCDVTGGSCAGPEAAQAPVEIASQAVFVNVSADGSHVFFTSEAALTEPEEKNERGEAAGNGVHNLYSWDGQSIHFVSRLDTTDFKSFGENGGVVLDAWTGVLNNPGSVSGRAHSPARSTPDGRVFLFQSHARLTSYDNEGRGEVYRYDPAASSGRLVCVSCDPSGASAGSDAMLEYAGTETFIAPTTLISNVTDNGSGVFFETPDRLLPQDVNDVTDVYEWLADGAGACKRTGGCLALISSGQGESPNLLYGMSADGHDVFFLTRDRLVSGDSTGSPSIYDARVEGGIPPPSAPAPCQGDACQGQPSQSPGQSSPASLPTGVGNVTLPDKPGASTRTLTRAQKLARALKACRHAPKRKRHRCEAQARKRYAAKKAAVRSANRGKARSNLGAGR